MKDPENPTPDPAPAPAPSPAPAPAPTPAPAPPASAPPAEPTLQDVGIVLDPKKTYSPDEVKALIADGIKKGAKISKDQLHKDIEAAKLRAQQAEKALEDAKKNIPPPAPPTPPADPELAKRLELMEAKAADAIIKAEDVEKQMKKERNEALIEKAVIENGLQNVRDLVTGETPEAIQASVERAKVKLAEIEKSIRTKLNLPAEPPKPANQEPITVERVSSDRHDLQDWKKRRNEVIKKVYSEAGFPV